MERVKYFPVTFFASVMGICGLAIAFLKAHFVFGLPIVFSQILSYFSAALFGILLAIYGIKVVKFFDMVKQEFAHPIRINFFGTISISLLLLSIAFLKIYPDIAQYLWITGAMIHTYLTFYVISFWIKNSFEIVHSNPAWFIPVVGNVLVPIAGVEFVAKEFASYYFSIGMFFWFILSSILFYRLIFHPHLAQKFMPTLFIFIAPPAVGFMAYMKLFETFDIIAIMLINITIFFTTLLFFMFKSFTKLKFFLSWWAFTFPLDAASIALMSAYDYSGVEFYKYVSIAVFMSAIVVVLVVFCFTIINIAKKEICVDE
jgi:tellurite resistance protein